MPATSDQKTTATPGGRSVSRSGDRAYWRSPALGEAREVDLPQGTVRYFERGSGPPIVFVHGLLVNANLWRDVVAALGDDFRCIVPDLPLGSHEVPLRADADLSPTGFADLIGDFLDALELENVTLVGNDTGGGLSQIAVTRRPERIGRLVLTSCDAFENFPPKAFRLAAKLFARVPGFAVAIMTPARPNFMRSTPLVLGFLIKSRPIHREASDSYLLPTLTNRGVRRDARKAAGGLDPRYTLEAAERLKQFERPALIAWSREDKFFPPAHAERLAETIPQARLEWIEDSYTFASEDQPERLAALIAGFVRGS
jgi:pimeloyl-ACP methyl ester carboxylesterase